MAGGICFDHVKTLIANNSYETIQLFVCAIRCSKIHNDYTL